MNIFYTNKNVDICAKEHCKVHTRKMIVEYLQLLSTAQHIFDKEKAIKGIYKPTHINHPCAIWVRESASNYNYLFMLVATLITYYNSSTGKLHKSTELLHLLSTPPINIRWGLSFTEPPKCMPEEFKEGTVEEAYKRYLNSKYEDWILRDKPVDVSWYIDKPDWATV